MFFQVGLSWTVRRLSVLVCLAVFLVLHDVATTQHTRPDLGQHSNHHKQDKADAQVVLGFVGATSSMAIMFQHGGSLVV
jgi:hypothetical protein